MRKKIAGLGGAEDETAVAGSSWSVADEKCARERRLWPEIMGGLPFLLDPVARNTKRVWTPEPFRYCSSRTLPAKRINALLTITTGPRCGQALPRGKGTHRDESKQVTSAIEAIMKPHRNGVLFERAAAEGLVGDKLIDGSFGWSLYTGSA